MAGNLVNSSFIWYNNDGFMPLAGGEDFQTAMIQRID